MSEYIIKCKEFVGISGKTMKFPEYIDLNQEIVRCRDCLSWHKGYCYKHVYEVANEYGDMFTEGVFPMDDSDFCSFGERREP